MKSRRKREIKEGLAGLRKMGRPRENGLYCAERKWVGYTGKINGPLSLIFGFFLVCVFDYINLEVI
jgi:hypothetical protein